MTVSGPVVLIPDHGVPVTASGGAAAAAPTTTAAAGRQGGERDKQKDLAAD